MSKVTIKAHSVITDDEADKRVKSAVKFAIAKQEAMGIPVPKYDRKKGYIYIINKEGKIEIVRKIADRRRYSERCK